MRDRVGDNILLRCQVEFIQNKYFAFLFGLATIIFLLVDETAVEAAYVAGWHLFRGAVDIFRNPAYGNFQYGAAVYLALLLPLALAHAAFIVFGVAKMPLAPNVTAEAKEMIISTLGRVRWGLPFAWLGMLAVVFFIPGDPILMHGFRVGSKLGFAVIAVLTIYAANVLLAISTMAWVRLSRVGEFK